MVGAGEARPALLREGREAGGGGRTYPLKALLSGKGMDDFVRARTLVIRGLGRMATEGETIEIVVDEYLERHDPERKAARLAEKDAKANGNGASQGNGHGREKSRHIPEAVLRAVLRVCGDRCMVDGCEREAFLHYAHKRPFAFGGKHVPWNLMRLCKYHHTQFDMGVWRPILKKDGTVAMVDQRGVVMGWFRRPRETATAAKPPP